MSVLGYCSFFFVLAEFSCSIRTLQEKEHCMLVNDSCG